MLSSPSFKISHPYKIIRQQHSIINSKDQCEKIMFGQDKDSYLLVYGEDKTFPLVSLYLFKRTRVTFFINLQNMYVPVRFDWDVSQYIAVTFLHGKMGWVSMRALWNCYMQMGSAQILAWAWAMNCNTLA